MNDAPPLLHIRGVAKTFGAVRALRSADLEVRPGEAHALMGANGAGKSTLVKIITGVFPADAGEMILAGQPVAFRSPAEARRAGIVSVYQDPAIVPDLTVAQNMRLARVSLDKVKAAMQDLGVERIDLRTVARDVDFALLRLIDLARALASDPHILMLDEITAALPADLSERVFKVVRDFRERGASVIFISHRMAEIAMLCDRATVLRDGVTVGVTPTKGGAETIVNLMLGSDVAKATAAPVARAPRPAAAREIPALEVERPELWSRAERRLLPGQSRRGARGRGLGRARPGRAVRLHRRRPASRRWRGASGRACAQIEASGRRDPRRARPRPGQSAGVAFAATVGAGERGAGRFWPIAQLGPHSDGRGETPGRRGRAKAPDRHPRRRGSAAPERRQYAEGCHRALDRRGVQDPALLRPDARHRHRHQAADLCAHARDRRSGLVGSPVHVRTAGNSSGLRSCDRLVRGKNLRGNAGGGRR